MYSGGSIGERIRRGKRQSLRAHGRRMRFLEPFDLQSANSIICLLWLLLLLLGLGGNCFSSSSSSLPYIYI